MAVHAEDQFFEAEVFCLRPVPAATATVALSILGAHVEAAAVTPEPSKHPLPSCIRESWLLKVPLFLAVHRPNKLISQPGPCPVQQAPLQSTATLSHFKEQILP